MVLTEDDALHQRVATALATRPGFHLLQRTEILEDAYTFGSQGIVDLLLVDQRLGPDALLAFLRELKQRLIDVPVVLFAQPEDADFIRRALLAGAKAFLPLYFAHDSLVQTVEDLVTGGEFVGGHPAGQIVAVASLKGGVGRTLVATNLAVALRTLSREPVALVDGQLIYGDTEIDLNLKPQHTIADLVDQVDYLEPAVLNEALVHHASGLRVLAAADDLDRADRIEPVHVERILQALRQHYPWTVVDTGNWRDERLDAMLEVSDIVLLVTTPELTSLRAARLFLQMTRQGRYGNSKVRLVINRADLLGAVPANEVERNLGVPCFATLSDDSALVTYSVNRGVPLVLSHKRKPLARGIDNLAERLLAERAPQGANKGKTSGTFFGLFRH